MSSSNTTTTTVISLSVEETNTLRQQLGLAPLRGATTTNAVVTAAAAISTTTRTKEREDSNHHHHNHNDSGCLELSIRETNQLRAQLGLKPLQMTTTTTSSSSSSSRHENSNDSNHYNNNNNNNNSKLPQHAPAIHEGERQALRERLERVKLQRELATNVQTQFATPALGTTDTDDDDTTTTKQQHTQSWAQRMRAATHISSSSSSSNNNTNNTAAVPLYQEDDLHGIHVRHTLAELPTDTTTILTLTDTPVLQLLQDNNNNDDDDEQPPTTELQNESLVQAQRGASTGGGGYVGYDDDEFDELGGGGTTISRRRPHDTTTTSQSATTTPRGFQIGVVPLPPKEEANKDGDRRLRTMASRAISLAAADNVDARPSDYMTVQEYWIDQQQQQQRKRHQSKKSRSRRTTRSEENAETNRPDATTSLLEDLDATAVAGPRRNIRKRRHDDDDDDDDPPRDAMEKEALTASTTGTAESLRSKRVRYEQVMAQGNVRSQQVFGKKQTPRSAMNDDDDDEPDDAFLNAAIEKARRWNRLKAMSSSTTAIKGADAVVAALQQANAATANNEGTTSASNGGGTTATGGNRITFQMDETHEFTRTLLARTEQMEREQARSKKKTMVATTPNNTGQQLLPDDSKSSGVVKEECVDVMDVDIQELAKDVKMDDITPQQYRIGLDGTTTAVPKIGRGVGGLLQLLQHSGELPAPKNEKPNQKEEMRGRAKDKRTYEDYEPLDLSKVVRIDERNATAKDRELASREVKLEYRDEHGRLLTRKEAFRDLSYQFHGYGSGKRKQEKKLQQIAREQAEARITSQQLNEGSVHTTFGALKETQRATGKAFVIHKT